MLRKEVIKPDLNHKYAHLCKQSAMPTEWLFGDDLPKAVKELEDQQKATGVVKSHHKFSQHFSYTKFAPYNLSNSPQRYREVGWFPSPRNAQRPFFRGSKVCSPKQTASSSGSAQECKTGTNKQTFQTLAPGVVNSNFGVTWPC